MTEGNINGKEYGAPHCDELILHAPKVCEFCDAFPERQQQRIRDNINFTGEQNPNKQICPAEARRPLDKINRWGGNVPETEERKLAREEYFEEIKRLTEDMIRGRKSED